MSLLSPRTIVITTTNNSSSGTKMTVQSGLLDNLNEMTEMGEPRKRRRLTHLTPDEKFLRRKLKNRVAAQTARDRKKAQMTDMEIKIAELEAQNAQLLQENKSLRVHSDSLVTENLALKERLGQCTREPTGLATSNELGAESPRSAASAVPLPQEQISTPIHWMKHYQAFVMVLSMVMCTAYCHNVTTKPVATSRKRKQSRPARLMRMKTEPENHMANKWWGPQQRSWNPSMNS